MNPFMISNQDYLDFHKKRIAWTLKKLRGMGAKKIVEVGGHPWVMTTSLMDEGSFQLVATISAEEMTSWPDDIGVSRKVQILRTPGGREAEIANYAVNLERTRFPLEEKPDTVLACEIVEHLIRSPHVMFLNINRWLSKGGRLLVTTPNGAQFFNPLRRKSITPAYRANIYERHFYLYTLNELIDLVSLCGFKILEAGYVDTYERQGMSSIYGWLAQLPWSWCQEKFKKMLYLVGEKEEDVSRLKGCPRVYDARGDWEFIVNGFKE